MSDKTTAQIAAKGCQSTGITDELIVRMHDQLGKKTMAVVELESFVRSENADGDEKVQLRILSIEPATTQVGEDHLRNFARALFMNRKLDEDQPTLDDGADEPTISDVLGQATGLIEHDDAGEITGMWDGSDEADEPTLTPGPEQQDDLDPDHDEPEDTRPWPGDPFKPAVVR